MCQDNLTHAEREAPSPVASAATNMTRVEKANAKILATLQDAEKEVQDFADNFNMKAVWGGLRNRDVRAKRAKMAAVANRLTKIIGEHADEATKLSIRLLDRSNDLELTHTTFTRIKSNLANFIADFNRGADNEFFQNIADIGDVAMLTNIAYCIASGLCNRSSPDYSAAIRFSRYLASTEGALADDTTLGLADVMPGLCAQAANVQSQLVVLTLEKLFKSETKSKFIDFFAALAADGAADFWSKIPVVPIQ